MTCYWLGSLGKLEWLEKYFKMKEEQIQKWVTKIHGRGSWVSIFVALPGVGDFIAVAMGYLRANAWGVLFWMTLGKFLRYLVVGEATKQPSAHSERSHHHYAHQSHSTSTN